MAIVRIAVADLPKLIRKMGPAGNDAVRRGLLSGCLRGVAEMQNRTTDAGILFSGRYRLGWKASPTPDGARIFNDSPHAPIMEEGRRPGARPPPKAIVERWAQLKLGLSPKDAKLAAFPIARAIGRRGMPAHHLLRDAVPALTQLVSAEVQKEVTRVLGGGK